MNKPRWIFLILAISLSLFMFLPELNFYPQLSTGDHGRDFYAAQAVLRGELPYKDFWWVYGPVMPYYYAFFYKMAGSTLVGFCLGKIILKVACVAFFYLAASLFMAPFLAFFAALWFGQAQQEFFFTFNHIGGITAQLWVLFMLFSYIQNPRIKFLWLALPAVFLYCLIKINFGLATLAVLGISSGLTDYIYRIPINAEKKKFYGVAFLWLPTAVFIIYWFLLKDLPGYAIHQCMPYFGDDQPHHFSPFVTIPYYLLEQWANFVHSPFNMFTGIMIHSAALMTAVLLFLGKIEAKRRQHLLLCLATLSIYFVLNFHEFVVSGVWYRTFWSLPFLFMFHFLMMAEAFRILPKIARRLIWTAWSALLALGFVSAIGAVQQQKIPPRFLNGPHAKIFVGNEPQWTETVNAVDAFLNQNLKNGEQFFALPYDCIYYYLADKPSPTRQLIFFDHIKIPREQEIKIIEELQSKNVQYVLMSNRIASSETGLGILGKTYCPLISAYIAQNYVPFARQGGNWQKEPGWGDNHGVLILKRK